jgi:GNAT superfamily N-acetyltransferase
MMSGSRATGGDHPDGREAIVWVRFTWDLERGPFPDAPPEGFDVGRAGPGSAETILQVVLEAYASDPTWSAILPGIERRMRTRIAETIGDPACEYLVVSQTGEIAAISGIAREHWTDQNLLTGICVRPAFQRRGLGAFLLGYSLHRLRAMGLASARVYTEAGSLADRKIYPRYGGRREAGVVYPGAVGRASEKRDA